MALAHTLGFPRIGADRELKKALEAYWKGDLDQAALRQTGRELRARHWQLQAQAGIELLPVGDFAWYDQMLAHSAAFGVVPSRFADALGADGRPTLDTLFAMARGAGSCCGNAAGETQHALELTKWFDTNYHYLVPEFSADQRFVLSWEQLFEEVDEAVALGHKVKPVLIGPLTYLWLGKAKGSAFDKLDLLERLLPVYGEILSRLARQGVEWVQIDEPILGLDLPQDWKNAFERAYHILQYSPLKKLLATYFASLDDNLGLAAGLPVDGLHVDLVRAPEQLPAVLDRLSTYKVLSVGVVNGRNVWRCDLEAALAHLQQARERFGANLWVASSCSLLHSPVDVRREDRLDAELKSWLAFAVQKCEEIAVLVQALNTPEALQVKQALAQSQAVRGQSRALTAHSQAGRASAPRRGDACRYATFVGLRHAHRRTAGTPALADVSYHHYWFLSANRIDSSGPPGVQVRQALGQRLHRRDARRDSPCDPGSGASGPGCAGAWRGRAQRHGRVLRRAVGWLPDHPLRLGTELRFPLCQSRRLSAGDIRRPNAP